MKKVLSLILIMFGSVSYIFASSLAGKVRSGNHLYKKGKYDKALDKFREAQISAPDNPIIHFNIGDALYKMENYDEANAEFNKTLNSKDPIIKSQAYFNLGDTALKQQKIDEALTYFKKALDLNPSDIHAKYNIEYILYHKDQLKQKPNNNNNKGQDKNKKEKQTGQAQKEKEGKNDKENKMSKEDAKRILQYYDESDKNAAKKRKMQMPDIPTVEEDW